MTKKNILYFVILIISVCLVAVSCNKLFPFNFSDANNVESFRIVDNKTPKVEINKNIVIDPSVKDTVTGDDYGEIVLSVDNGVNFFPLIFTANIIVSANADIRSWPKELALSFDNLNDTKSFFVASASGLVKKWIIRIVDKTIPPEAKKSNTTTIKSFTFPTFTEGTLTFDATKLNYTTDSIYLPYDQSQALTNVSFTPTIELATGASFTAGYIAGTPITLNADGTAFPITVVAEDGKTTKTYYIALKPFTLGVGSGEAEIVDLTIKTVSPSQAAVTTKMKGFIDKANAIIYIPEYTVYTAANFAAKPIELGVKMTISDKASFPTGYLNKLTFTDFNPQNFDIKAENGTIKTWRIQLLLSPQIAGSDFESWKNTTAGSYVPFVELNSSGTWVVNNNQAPVIGAPSNMVNPSSAGDAFTGVFSAKLTTIYEYIQGTQNVTNPILAGNVFLGSFKSTTNDSNVLRNPLRMETNGIPFTYAPKFVHVAMKYSPASPMIWANPWKYTRQLTGDFSPSYDPFVISGNDACEIWVKVQDAGGKDIGTGYFSTESTISNWTEIYIPITYTSSNAPAKFLMHCTSSKGGGEYKGASGIAIGKSPGYNIIDNGDHVVKTGLTPTTGWGNGGGNPIDEPTTPLASKEVVIYGSTLFIDNVELIYLPKTYTDAYPYPALPR